MELHVSLDKQLYKLKLQEINEKYLVRLMRKNQHGFLNQVRHKIEHQAGNIIELTIEFDCENQLEIHIV